MRIPLLVALVLLVGCAAPRAVTAVSWTGDGNPGVPLCGPSRTTDCVSAIQIKDLTTGAVATLPPAATGWISPTVGHQFAGRVVGFGTGPLQSAWESAAPGAP